MSTTPKSEGMRRAPGPLHAVGATTAAAAVVVAKRR